MQYNIIIYEYIILQTLKIRNITPSILIMKNEYNIYHFWEFYAKIELLYIVVI